MGAKILLENGGQRGDRDEESQTGASTTVVVLLNFDVESSTNALITAEVTVTTDSAPASSVSVASSVRSGFVLVTHRMSPS